MKKLLIIIASFLSMVIILYVLSSAYDFNALDITYIGDSSPAGWHDRLNIVHNSFYSWKISPVINLLSGLTDYILPDFSNIDLIISLSIFLSGFVAYLVHSADGNLSYKMLTAPVLTLTVLFLYSFDTVVLYSTCSFFWLLLFTERCLKSEKLISADSFALALSLYLCLTSANQLSALIIFTAYFTALSAGNRDRNYSLILVFIAASFYSFNTPNPHAFSYPQLSHVVPDDNLPGYIMPLYGSAPPIPYTDRQIFKDYFALPSIFLLISGAILLNTNRERLHKKWLIIILALSCVLETQFSESISSISPVYTLNRVFPGAIFIPYLPVIFGLTLSLIALEIYLLKRMFFPFLIVVAAIPFLNQLRTVSTNYLSYSSDGIIIPKARPLVELDSELKRGIINRERYSLVFNKLVSPSYNVAFVSGKGIFDHFNKNYADLKIKHKDIEYIGASKNSVHESLHQMFDDRQRSRWSPQTGSQNGDEWLEIRMNEPKTVRGIYMPCGNFKADFPRGLQISAAPDCHVENGRLAGDFSTLYKAPIWEGNIDFTEQGAPYFNDQAEVRIIFRDPALFRCIRVNQTGKTSSYDWSIAEFGLITE